MSRTYTPEDVVQIVLRRRWLILVPFALGLAVSGPIGDRVPERYRSETLIQVVPQRVPDLYVRSTVTESVADRLSSINEQILSRSRLERIITDFDLYSAERARSTMEDVVVRMRSRVGVTIARTEDSFRVSFESQDPATAQRVTQRLAALYIEQNQLDRTNRADNTSRFIGSSVEDTRQQLVEHDLRLEEYRRRYAGELPTQHQGNLQAMQNAQMQLQNVHQATNRARERRLLMESQLGEVRALPPALVAGDASAPGAPSTPAQQLESAQTQLEALRLRFTPLHPDVVDMEAVVAELEKRVAEDEAATDARAESGEDAPVERALSPAEIVHDLRIRRIEGEIEAIDRELAGYAGEEARLARTIDDLQARIDRLPTRESELVELTRDYNTLQQLYASLRMRQEDSNISANLERRQIGEQFRIIDQASLPEAPFNQRERLMYMSAGAIAGLGLGLLLVGFLEYRDTSFRREEDVARALSLPVLALVPVMANDREQKTRRLRMIAADVAGTGLVLAAIAAVVLWQVRT